MPDCSLRALLAANKVRQSVPDIENENKTAKAAIY